MKIFKLFLGLVLFLILTVTPVFAASGAIFTTDSDCAGTNINIFSSKDAVYLDGGPTHPVSAGLPDGSYYVRVTEPNGTLLGIGGSLIAPTIAVTVSGGEFVQCYQLSAILIKVTDSTQGYDTTSNNGGEYKVWVSKNSDFSSSKTDNFKVKGDTGPSTTPTPPPQARLRVQKFYDVNANGTNYNEDLITGWKINIHDDINYIRFTPVDIILDPGTYNVSEFSPIETNWIPTTINPVNITLENRADETVRFGNVCIGAGGGHTLGFWSNKNGQAAMNDNGTLDPELALLSGMNLKNGSGLNFDPTNYALFRDWILGAKATNMAYMLSAQLAAMALNVEAGFVNGNPLVYAPGVPGTNSLGFINVVALIKNADIALSVDGYTPAGDPNRATQEALKNALDKANNNTTFVQANPCAFSFL